MSTKRFSLPHALSLALTKLNINQGDRGELLVAAFFTWARDRIVCYERTTNSLALISQSKSSSKNCFRIQRR